MAQGTGESTYWSEILQDAAKLMPEKAKLAEEYTNLRNRRDVLMEQKGLLSESSEAYLHVVEDLRIIDARLHVVASQEILFHDEIMSLFDEEAKKRKMLIDLEIKPKEDAH